MPSEPTSAAPPRMCHYCGKPDHGSAGCRFGTPTAFPTISALPAFGPSPGMTLRDYFAAAALSHPYTQADDAHERADKAACWAYELAAAMLAERAK